MHVSGLCMYVYTFKEYGEYVFLSLPSPPLSLLKRQSHTKWSPEYIVVNNFALLKTYRV